MLNQIKPAIVPGILAYLGVRAGGMVAGASVTWQLVGGIAGAIAGILVSKHV